MHKAQEVSQYASDIWLHRALQMHIGLTARADEADLFFVPFYGMLSTMLERPCKGTVHDNRTKVLAAYLAKAACFHTHGTRHMLTISHWDVRPIMQSLDLRPMIDDSGMRL